MYLRHPDWIPLSSSQQQLWMIIWSICAIALSSGSCSHQFFGRHNEYLECAWPMARWSICHTINLVPVHQLIIIWDRRVLVDGFVSLSIRVLLFILIFFFNREVEKFGSPIGVWNYFESEIVRLSPTSSWWLLNFLEYPPVWWVVLKIFHLEN